MFRLNHDGTLANKVGSGEWHNVETSAQYLAWLEAGNTPEPAPVAPVTWDSIRAKRDQIIRDTDWTMTPDASVDQAQWAAYRQILRDLPQTFAKTGPESVIWPTEPSTAGPNSTPVE